MALNAATGHLSMSFSSIPEIVDELRRGRMVVIVDDEDRENEGDLVMAASCVRPEDINFMARYGRARRARRGPRAARPHLPAHGAARRRAHARGPHRGGL